MPPLIPRTRKGRRHRSWKAKSTAPPVPKKRRFKYFRSAPPTISISLAELSPLPTSTVCSMGLGPKRFAELVIWLNALGNSLSKLFWQTGWMPPGPDAAADVEMARQKVLGHVSHYLKSVLEAVDDLVADACTKESPRFQPDPSAIEAFQAVKAILAASDQLQRSGLDGKPIVIEARRLAVKVPLLGMCIFLLPNRSRDILRKYKDGKQPVIDITWYMGRIAEAMQWGDAAPYLSLSLESGQPSTPSCKRCIDDGGIWHDPPGDKQIIPHLRRLLNLLKVEPERGSVGCWKDTGARGIVDRYRHDQRAMRIKPIKVRAIKRE